MKTPYKKPSTEKYVNFKSELGSNGQFDEIAFELFEEDNPGDENELNLQNYCKDLQNNFNNRVKL